ncbi:MAG: hypoxanthine phosphoribosyltransferase [Candidatus Jettenia sp.]|uniref:Hypoxanthine phosphoribosyltransferase n=1 Tax=Candidatus Jettenia caeni TaxID=247490 RepID=I3IQB0_9BACT|nr:MAG: hypoxanthine phosphoribosyltransferase [Candidatus Jettenia sp. AMX1]MBC6927992.1 hypoxanthine phosphoribosyltransferase [Candidatus Jettenia sp.]NUN23689.1 hypoxanthine phosphoribosyltransferase [Candidatus Jettenia caeni]MCE7881000.1 hypoxanthine phosphoribosyltransferase [Candidatus Jettenia sp. AMX1]WKZ15219.1 MAG: hypoxanthine phosphoribosyltransferase [Candidatus Jettenia caeni]
MEKDIARVIIREEQIRNKLHELSKTLIHDYQGKEWTIIAILNGSLVFLADLIRLIPFPIRLDTIDAATYGEYTFPKGETKVVHQFKIDIEDKHVLVIDDIIDTGSTLKRVLDDIKGYHPKTLKSCVLLNRLSRRRHHIHPEYCCFDIGDDFVVGYGLDYNNKYRNLPFIGVLKDECYRR